MISEVPTIALRAYQLWDEAGRPEGRADDFWFLAEEEFRDLLEAGVAGEVREQTVAITETGLDALDVY
jgi:hypothetical protein